MRSFATLCLGIFLIACHASDPAADARTGDPVETRPPNGVDQQPAFPGQTRAPAVRTGQAMVSEVIVSGLEHPWAVTPLSEREFLVTERPGRLRVVTSAGDIGLPIRGLPAVHAEGQGGLLDVELSPTFAQDRLVYWSYAEPREGGAGTAVARGRLSGDQTRVENVEVIFRAQPTFANGMHFGSRLVFDREGRLYVTLGERSSLETRAQAQALDSHFGKIVRINPDGSVPADNPFVGRDDARPEIWSLGHRNVQGAALHPDTGALWSIEHGARGGDEINVPAPGANYGWPVVAYGIEYRGGPIGEGLTAGEGFEPPVYYWDPVIAPGGAVFYQGDMFPGWRGDLLVSGLAGRHLARLVLDGERVVGEERLLTDLGERIRDVAVAADGAVWVVTDDADGKLVRLAAR